MSAAQLAAVASCAAPFAYGFQIYFDFCGYSDMAVGLSLLFGVRLPLNFASPYKATSTAEFWTPLAHVHVSALAGLSLR